MLAITSDIFKRLLLAMLVSIPTPAAVGGLAKGQD
jgi:hypothetical protein